MELSCSKACSRSEGQVAFEFIGPKKTSSTGLLASPTPAEAVLTEGVPRSQPGAPSWQCAVNVGTKFGQLPWIIPVTSHSVVPTLTLSTSRMLDPRSCPSKMS